jgi:DNA-binding transcriptional ArsR family regulator
LEFHAEFCKTFSNPKRLEILNLLKGGEVTVGAVAKKLGVAKANVSQHLTVKRVTRILKTRRDGTNGLLPNSQHEDHTGLQSYAGRTRTTHEKCAVIQKGNI